MIPKKRCLANHAYFHRSILFSTLLSIFLIAVLLVFPYPEGHCSQVTLTWDPNSEPDLAGYDIYYGTASGNYQWKTDVGNVTTYTQSGLNIGATYYFAATAYNTQGLSSGFSNEVVYAVPSCTFSLSPSSASFSASGGSGSVVVTTQAGCNWGTSTAPSWITVNSGSGIGSGTMSYTVTPNTGTTQIASLTVAGNVFTITEAGLATYTITASAGTGGTISPSSATVTSGGSRTFTITPNTGYNIAGVTVDGVSQGAVSSYTFSNVTATHAITATFLANTYTITASAGTGGTISPSSATVTSGGSRTFTITPNTGYNIAGVTVDGASVGAVASYTFTNVTASHTIAATFTAISYTITASAGTGGTISPSSATVTSGGSQTFTITPNTGYNIAGVTVDGVSQGAVSSYTFSNVTATHAITATFLANTYTITASAGTGGTISPSSATVTSGGSRTFTIIPNTGYNIAGVTVDGASVGAVASYTFTNVTASHTIAAAFTAISYTITASAGTGGTISPSSATVTSGGSRTFTITPNTGYNIAGVTMDGASVGAVASYTFTNVTASHTIAATFTAISYTITASAGTGGTISPSSATVTSGGSQTFTITPNTGYNIAGVTVDGASAGAVASYTFTNVTASHTMAATFTAIPNYTLTVNKTGTGSGSVSPNPIGPSYSAGALVTLTATPNANSTFNGWSGGGCSGNTNPCQVTMNANISVTATFNAVLNPPVVVTGSATLVPSSSAQLNGTVNPKGLSTTYVFQWGRTTSYGSTTAVTTAGSGTGDAPSSANITRLRANTVYHYRLKATNSAGTTYGEDKSFTNNRTYTITASAGTGGVISPSGGTNVQSGANQTFAVTANTGYKIADVSVDSVSQGAISSYTFSAVNANHTIVASFISKTYTLTITNAGTGSGSVSSNPTGTSFPAGTQVTLTSSPDANSVFSGWSGDCSGTMTTCQVTMTANMSVTATFNISTANNPPTVVTGSATLVPWSSATLTGKVNPSGLPTTYVFQWGRTTSYGNNTALANAGSGTGDVNASAGITRLSSYTVYHYRLVATNSAGTTYGADMTFKTRFTGIR